MGLVSAQNLQPVQLDASEKIVAIHPTGTDVMVLTQKPDPGSQSREYLSSSYLLYSLLNQEPVFSFKGLLLYTAPDMSRIVRFSGHAIYDYEQEPADATGRVTYRVKNKIRIGTFIPTIGAIAKSEKDGREYFIYAGLTTRRPADTLSYFHQNDHSRPEKVMHMYYGYAIIDLQSPKPAESLVRTCILPIKRRNQIFSIRPNVDANKLFISYINSKSLMLEIALDLDKGYKMYFKDEDTPIQYAPSDDSGHFIYPYLLQPEAVKHTMHQSVLHMSSNITFIRFSRESVFLDLMYNQVTRETLWHLFAVDLAASTNTGVPTTESMTADDLSASSGTVTYGTYAFEVVRNGGIFPFLPTGSLYYHDYSTNTLQYISKKRLEKFIHSDIAGRCACRWENEEIDFFINTPELVMGTDKAVQLTEELFKLYKHTARRLIPVQDTLQSSAAGLNITTTYAPNVLAMSAPQPSNELLREIGEMKTANKNTGEALETIRKELESLKEVKAKQDDDLDSLKTAMEATDANYKNIYDAVEELKEKQEELQAAEPLASGALGPELLEKINAAADMAQQADLIRNQVLEMDGRMAEVETQAAKLAADVQELEKNYGEERANAAILGDSEAIMAIVNEVKDDVNTLKDQVKDQGEHIAAIQDDYNGYKEAVNNRFVVLEESVLEIQRNIPIEDEDSFDFDPHSIRIDEDGTDSGVQEARIRNKLLTDDDDDDDLLGMPNVQQMRVVPKERAEPALSAADKIPVPDAELVEPLQAHAPLHESQDLSESAKEEVKEQAEAWGPDSVERLPDIPPSDGDDNTAMPLTEVAPISTTTLDAFDDFKSIDSPAGAKQDPAVATDEMQTSNTMQSPQIDFEDLSVGGWTGSPDPKPRLETLPNALQSPGDEFEKLTKDDFDMGESATLNPNAAGDTGQDVDDFAEDFDDFDI